MYERCDEQNKRLANQTFFTRIYLNEGDGLIADTAAAFATILEEITKQQASPGPKHAQPQTRRAIL